MQVVAQIIPPTFAINKSDLASDDRCVQEPRIEDAETFACLIFFAFTDLSGRHHLFEGRRRNTVRVNWHGVCLARAVVCNSETLREGRISHCCAKVVVVVRSKMSCRFNLLDASGPVLRSPKQRVAGFT